MIHVYLPGEMPALFPGSDSKHWVSFTKEHALSAEIDKEYVAHVGVIDFDDFGRPADYSKQNVLTWLWDIGQSGRKFPATQKLSKFYKFLTEVDKPWQGCFMEQNAEDGSQYFTFVKWDGTYVHTFGKLTFPKRD
jgi:hypothetical protein